MRSVEHFIYIVKTDDSNVIARIRLPLTFSLIYYVDIYKAHDCQELPTIIARQDSCSATCR